MRKYLSGVLSFVLFFSAFSFASASWAAKSKLNCAKILSVNRASSEIDAAAWLANQKKISLHKMLENISRPDTVPGTVVAATTRENPNYYYHWVRDAALVINTLLLTTGDGVADEFDVLTDKILRDYATLSRRQQMTWTRSSWSGEPKFNPDGTAFADDWGRPQIDGPPLRAMTLIRWAKQLILQGEADYVRKVLYDSSIPTQSVIKGDLEYTAHHWNETSFDLWEEVKGRHFYTLMVSMSALNDGAYLAIMLGDIGAASYYGDEARKIRSFIADRLVKSELSRILTTVDQEDGLTYKTSQIDIAVVLGLLHAPSRGDFLNESAPVVLTSVETIIDAFRGLYRLNREQPELAPAIGRYPEDLYGGATFAGGNPWVLTTLAAAEFYYKRSQALAETGESAAATEAIRKGDTFVARMQLHTGPDGALSEQFSRENGYMTSVENLTWSYAASITAALARDKAVAALSQ